MQEKIRINGEGFSSQENKKAETTAIDVDLLKKEKELEECGDIYNQAEIFGFPDRGLAELESKFGDTETVKDFKDKVRQVADAALCNDTALYLAFTYYDYLGETDKIKERVTKGIALKSGYIDISLYRRAFDFCDDLDTLENYTKQAILQERSFDSLHRIDFFEKQKDTVVSYLNSYSVRHSLPEPYKSIEAINSAQEIIKLNYDIIISVMNGGGYFAATVEALGGNVRYLEWHRDWKKGPTWRKIGKNTDIDKNGYKKILVLENDMVSGETLLAIIPELQKLTPEQVDVCFSSPEYKNKYSLEGIPVYNKMLKVATIEKKNVFQNLKDSVHIAKTGV